MERGIRVRAAPIAAFTVLVLISSIRARMKTYCSELFEMSGRRPAALRNGFADRAHNIAVLVAQFKSRIQFLCRLFKNVGAALNPSKQCIGRLSDR